MKHFEKCPICQSDLSPSGQGSYDTVCSKKIYYKPKCSIYHNSHWWVSNTIECIYSPKFGLNIFHNMIHIYVPDGDYYRGLEINCSKDQLDYSSYNLDIIDQKIQTILSFS